MGWNATGTAPLCSDQGNVGESFDIEWESEFVGTEGGSIGRRWRLRGVAAALLGLVLGGTLAPLGLAGAVAAEDNTVLSPREDAAYFGSILDWSTDSAADQAKRLRDPSAVYGHSFAVPLSDQEQDYLAQFVAQAAEQGSLATITLQPGVPLRDIDSEFADDLVRGLTDAIGPDAAPVYVRFATDMNAGWVPWGQQPSAYRAAFGQVADAVHRDLPGAVMVWSPSFGGSYPFAAARPATTDILRELDSNGDGTVDGVDDPYGPFYPGDEHVDWVGLSIYHDDSAGGAAVNTVPRQNELIDRLGPTAASEGFYARFAAESGKKMMLETAALHSPAAGGPGELAVKQTWWRQAFSAVKEFDSIDVVLWRDTQSTRSAVGETVIDWSVTLGSATRAEFSTDLAASDLALGPVIEPRRALSASASRATATDGTTLSGVVGWVVVGLVFAAAIGLFLGVVTARRRGSLGYTGPPGRDLRVDMFRGVAIVFVVVNHVGLTSLFQTATQEAIGVVSGAELFVLLSGVVLGMVYRPRLVSGGKRIVGGVGEAVEATARRAWKLYCTALVVVLLIFFVGLLPFVDASYVTTFTDQGTGAAGSSATGRVYDLYTNAAGLLQYPVNPQILLDIALLRLGPWQFNVMGLYVVLLAITPIILAALARRRWLIVLSVSVGIYVIELITRWRVVPSQFEGSFPLLAWQLLFVVGMLAGFYRPEVVEWFRGRAGTFVVGVAVVLSVAFAIFSWNNPYLASAADVRLGLIPNNVFRPFYDALFGRTHLEPGRLLNVLLVVIVGYALLDRYWKPIHTAVGWFFIPLGQATLYVFVMHVFFALIASNIPFLQQGNLVVNTAVYVVILGLLWVMVKTRFLFRVVPR